MAPHQNHYSDSDDDGSIGFDDTIIEGDDGSIVDGISAGDAREVLEAVIPIGAKAGGKTKRAPRSDKGKPKKPRQPKASTSTPKQPKKKRAVSFVEDEASDQEVLGRRPVAYVAPVSVPVGTGNGGGGPGVSGAVGTGKGTGGRKRKSMVAAEEPTQESVSRTGGGEEAPATGEEPTVPHTAVGGVVKPRRGGGGKPKPAKKSKVGATEEGWSVSDGKTAAFVPSVVTDLATKLYIRGVGAAVGIANRVVGLSIKDPSKRLEKKKDDLGVNLRSIIGRSWKVGPKINLLLLTGDAVVS
jgi:hypothetical protein